MQRAYAIFFIIRDIRVIRGKNSFETLMTLIFDFSIIRFIREIRGIRGKKQNIGND
jgi:hypothetical protein